MAAPSATILLSVNGGAYVQTSAAVPQGQTVPSAATIQLKGQDITGWQQASWEIFCFPPGWAGPAGADWSYDAVRNLYVSHQFQPSLITLPASAAMWGKWICRLVVNNGVGPGSNGVAYSDVGQPLPSTMLDVSGAWQTTSSVLGLSDVGLFEGAQFGGYRQWVQALQTMLRSIDQSGAGTAKSVAQFGAVDPTGTLDSSAAFQTAVTALAGTGVALFVPAGTYKIASPIVLPSNITIIGTPNTVLNSTIAPSGGQSNTIFYAQYVNSGAPTTLASNNVLGATTVSSTTSIPGGTIIRINDAATALYVGYYVVQSVSGVGPYTLTLDRAVLRQWHTSDVIQPVSSQPTNIRIFGNGMVLTGTGDRYWECFGGYKCLLDGIIINDSGGFIASNSIGASMDLGSRECVIRNCRAFVNGKTQIAVALESAERSYIEDCWVTGATVAGFDIYDSVSCALINSHSWGGGGGAAINADATSIGCTDCAIVGGSYNGASGAGVVVAGGSTRTRLIGVEIRFNGTYGIQEDLAGGATNGTIVQSCSVTNNATGYLLEADRASISNSDFSNNTSQGVNVNANCSLIGIRARGGNPGGALVIANGAKTVRVSGLEAQCSSNTWAAVQIGTNVKCSVTDSHIQIDGTGSQGFLPQSGSVTTLANVTVDGSGVAGTIGWYGNTGSVAKFGLNVDMSTFGGNALFAAAGATIAYAQDGSVYTSVITTGTDTLSQLAAECSIIASAASLTGSVIVNVPQYITGRWIVYANVTLNAHTFTVGVTGGTGVTFTAGEIGEVWSDGANMRKVTGT